MPNVYAIIPAAGLSTRMGSTTTGQERKQMAEVGGAPILIHTLRKFAALPEIERIWVPVRPEDRERVAERVAEEGFRCPVEVLNGGNSRQESVWNAVQRLEALHPGDSALVLVHDAVRPFVTGETIQAAIAAAAQHGAVIVATPAVDTVKQVQRVAGDANCVIATLPRERIVLAQTPQVFRLGLLRQAFAKARADGFYATDESSLIEHFGHDVYVVPGSARNWKITSPGDLPLAELFLNHSA